MQHKIILLTVLLCLIFFAEAQTPQPLRQFLRKKEMKGASFGFMVRNIETGEVRYSYDEDRELIPASVMKLLTTASALEILGGNFRYSTMLEYDGEIVDGILNGNLYIKGSGDPTLGSSHFAEGNGDTFYEQNLFIREWVNEVKEAGINQIMGSIIADESIFDTQGLSLKWLMEDMGSWYGAGSHGISVFDNIYRVYLKSGVVGEKPAIINTEPDMPFLRFHNYLTAAKVSADSSYIIGFPFSEDRYLYGIVPAGRNRIRLRGDIPDPALFLAHYLTKSLEEANIFVEKLPDCYRRLKEEGKWKFTDRKPLAVTYSPELIEIIRIINEKSHNLYADAILKTMGSLYNKKDKSLSSLSKGIDVVNDHWKRKGWDMSSVWMYDGSGLAPIDKITANFICDLLVYMNTSSASGEGFIASLPIAGKEGSVRNFLTGNSFRGTAYIKSGSMSRVKAYAGYIEKPDARYAFALLVNNYIGEGKNMNKEIEKLLIALF